MKSTDRHRLKEDEFTRSVMRARAAIEARRRTITILVAAGLVVALLVGGFFWWRQSRLRAANELLATALAAYDAPVVPITPPSPGSAPPLPQPGTYPTEQAKLEAAIPQLQTAADRYPGTEAGLVARFHLANALAALGRYGEAEQQYQQVVTEAGGSIYARTARLGLADVQVAQKKYDDAITTYTDLTRATDGPLPLDSVLMQLGRAYAQAGRKEEAARTFDRVLQEFPDSIYAADARQEMEAARQS
jgi:TolA-binding protein